MSTQSFHSNTGNVLPFIWKFEVYLGFFIFLIANGVQAGDSQTIEHCNLLPDSTFQPYRTAYHFQPPKNWMNDPNGPVYYKGVYHFFYQYNPYSALWGNMTWAHSVSYNLVDWIHLEHVLYPTDPYDLSGCWSGSITTLEDGNPVILYTGKEPNSLENQNLAMPKNVSDPLLREWVKSDHNPLLLPPKGINIDHFRDPTTAWLGKDKLWRMAIGSEINGHGAALLYKSHDFVNWTKTQNPLHSSNKTNMWECPDFFPVSTDGRNGLDTSNEGEDIKHVLKASFSGQDHYVIGNYDSEMDSFVVDTDFMDSGGELRYDYGIFYASKTFYDSAKKRRILWAWVTEADDQSDDISRGWSGLQSFPRSMWLDKTEKRLVQWPVQEIERLRENEVNHQNKEIKGGTVFEISGITASQADIEITFHPSHSEKAEVLPSEMLDPQLLCSKNNASSSGVLGPFGLLALASEDLTEYTAVFFRIYKGRDNYVVLMCSDQTSSSLASDVNKSIFGAFVDEDPTKKISLRSLIDHSIIESFGGEGRACITARVYPRLAIDEGSRLYAFNNGSESVTISNLRAWSMKKAQIFSDQKRREPEIIKSALSMRG